MLTLDLSVPLALTLLSMFISSSFPYQVCQSNQAAKTGGSVAMEALQTRINVIQWNLPRTPPISGHPAYMAT